MERSLCEYKTNCTPRLEVCISSPQMLSSGVCVCCFVLSQDFLKVCVCCFVLLYRYWGIVTVPGSIPYGVCVALFYYTDIGESLRSRGQFLTEVDLGWPDPHPSP